MYERLLAPLAETLSPHSGLGKTRLETLAVLLVGLANCRTVNLSHLPSQFPGGARHGSDYRRLQRFFQVVGLDGDVAARRVMRSRHGQIHALEDPFSPENAASRVPGAESMETL